MAQRLKIKPAPMPNPRSRRMTDVTPKTINTMVTNPKKKSPAKPAAPKAKGRIFKGTGKVVPALPSSSSKMGKMNRKAY